MTSQDSTVSDKERAIAALSNVWDPELAIDVVSLGLIYDIRFSNTEVGVDMTLTTPGCPVSESLPLEVAEALRSEFVNRQVWVNLVWDPPWDPSRITGNLSGVLGVMGDV